MDDSLKFGIELVLASAIWLIGRSLWMLRFTRQWIADMLRDRGALEELIRISRDGAPLRKLTRSIRPPTELPEDFAVETETTWRRMETKWERHQQLFFAVLILLLVASVGISVYALIFNVFIPVIASRFIGNFNNAFHRAGAELLAVINLLMLWYEQDSAACEGWCKVSHSEFAQTLGPIRAAHAIPVISGV